MSTPLDRALNRERSALELDTDDDTDTTTVLPTGISSHTTIAGEQVDREDPETAITFQDTEGFLSSGEHGKPRPRAMWHAKQLGQTPPMRLIKHGITQQLTGGDVTVLSDDELSGGLEDLADLIEDIYSGPHYQRLGIDDLITGAVDDLVDAAWAYWEILPSADGSFPVAGFKPLPALQIQHNLSDDTGEIIGDPAYWHVPFSRTGSQIQVTTADPTPLPLDQVVAMRGPLTYEADHHYGTSLALKVREWIELITDVDVHQKRHYDDSRLPAGFLHFVGGLSDDELTEIEQDVAEVSGDPHELVTTSTEDDAKWIPVGESVVDLDAIAEQKWYFKLVFAAAGLNAAETGLLIGEDAGFAKETPAQVRQTFKKVAKPYKSAIFDAQNNQVRHQIFDGFDVDVDDDLRIDLERFDPLQEQIQRDETLSEWDRGILSLNEMRAAIGRDAVDVELPVGEADVELGELPKYVVEKAVQVEQPTMSLGEGAGEASVGEQDGEGPPDHDQHPVLSQAEAFQALGLPATPETIRQLENTISIQSSFIASTAYDRTAPLMQITFDRVGPNATYWYGNVEEFRFFNFLQASSKGSYFNKYIRHTGDPGYPYARVR